jgi:hypothetical protein
MARMAAGRQVQMDFRNFDSCFFEGAEGWAASLRATYCGPLSLPIDPVACPAISATLLANMQALATRLHLESQILRVKSSALRSSMRCKERAKMHVTYDGHRKVLWFGPFAFGLKARRDLMVVEEGKIVNQ